MRRSARVEKPAKGEEEEPNGETRKRSRSLAISDMRKALATEKKSRRSHPVSEESGGKNKKPVKVYVADFLTAQHRIKKSLNIDNQVRRLVFSVFFLLFEQIIDPQVDAEAYETHGAMLSQAARSFMARCKAFSGTEENRSCPVLSDRLMMGAVLSMVPDELHEEFNAALNDALDSYHAVGIQ